MDVPMFLIMSGSMGFGKLAVFAAELALRCRNGEHIVIICGNNAKIERILRKEFHFNKRVHIIGYTNHVSLLWMPVMSFTQSRAALPRQNLL